MKIAPSNVNSRTTDNEERDSLAHEHLHSVRSLLDLSS